MMLSDQQARSLPGRQVQDKSGKKIGTVGQVWMDATGQPNWVSVKTGLFGMRESMVPLHPARMEQDHLTVPYDKDMIKDAPHVEAEAEQPLSGPEVEQLYMYYRLESAPKAGGAPPKPDGSTRHRPGAQEELTRSEERLHVGKERQSTGTARLLKYVVTENVHQTIPVEHDEVRLEREPITADRRGGSRPDIGESAREVELHAERPVVSKERVPVERVRMTEDHVTEDRTIDEPVRHEQIEADFPESSRKRRASS